MESHTHMGYFFQSILAHKSSEIVAVIKKINYAKFIKIGQKFDNPKNLDCIGARSFEKSEKQWIVLVPESKTEVNFVRSCEILTRRC